MENFFNLLIIGLFLAVVTMLIIVIAKHFNREHYNWKEKAQQEEKELRQSLTIVKSIDQFNQWIFKYDDEEFVNVYKNDFSGSVSKDRLASLKLYDQFIDLGDAFFNVKNGIFNLPESFFSKISISAKREIEKIEEQKKLLLDALKRKHVSSTEAILTVRKSMKLYYNLISVPLSDIANLDIHLIEGVNKETQDLIRTEKEKIKLAKKHLKGTTGFLFWGDAKVKRSVKRSVRDSKKIIRHNEKLTKDRNTDLKLRRYLIKHGNIQKTAREYLTYIQSIKTPLTEEQLKIVKVS